MTQQLCLHWESFCSNINVSEILEKDILNVTSLVEVKIRITVPLAVYPSLNICENQTEPMNPSLSLVYMRTLIHMVTKVDFHLD